MQCGKLWFAPPSVDPQCLHILPSTTSQKDWIVVIFSSCYKAQGNPVLEPHPHFTFWFAPMCTALTAAPPFTFNLT